MTQVVERLPHKHRSMNASTAKQTNKQTDLERSSRYIVLQNEI
jgi:hypothetical protein